MYHSCVVLLLQKYLAHLADNQWHYCTLTHVLYRKSLGDVKTFQRDLRTYDAVFGHARSTSTGLDTVRLWKHHQVQTGSRNSTPNRMLATKTDIDAISLALPMFLEQVFHWCISVKEASDEVGIYTSEKLAPET